MAASSALLLFALLFFPYLLGSHAGVTFTLKNYCGKTLWPAIVGKPPINITGLQLSPGRRADVEIPTGWSGRFWARTGCSFDPSGQNGNCATGDCGGRFQCDDIGGQPPASLAEFSLGDGSGRLDFYDVSYVDGFNVPIYIYLLAATSGNCSDVKCTADLNPSCPEELRVTSGGVVVACKSACIAFKDEEYCCTGAYNSPQLCKPTAYSRYFKTGCPSAFSYAFDDGSLFNCMGSYYVIQFC
ncbi:hypothetical protein ABFS82_08G193300 [Erythranthe guttata]|uniref:Thaumatin-like protein n=1 Tax=Erythranthe guttata TaxID=4155 RepID=A0A022QIF1_ERYGU|nr:hypothetical protein MIMGU_mgv1a012734mg [Erythranthe guttata]